MSLDFNAAVESLQRTAQIPRDRAEQIIRAQAPSLGVSLPPDPDAARDAHVLEKTEQSEITKLFRAQGFTVYSLSQPRAAKQTPGLPDLWITRAARFDNDRSWTKSPAFAFWWESKRQVGGKRSSAQVDFAAECTAAGVGYGFGDRYDAATYLASLGITQLA